MKQLVRDLNWLYRGRPALHQRDCESEGFSWIDCNDTESSVISYIRKAADPNDFVVVICNFTPVVRQHYRIGVPRAGTYREILNTDSTFYGGGNVGNAGGVPTQDRPSHGTLPPLGVLVLAPEGM